MNILNSIAPCHNPFLLIEILAALVLVLSFLPVLLDCQKEYRRYKTYLRVTRERDSTHNLINSTFKDVYKMYQEYGFKEQHGMDGLYWSPSPGSHDYIDVFEIFINEEYYILNFSDWKRLKKKIGFW